MAAIVCNCSRAVWKYRRYLNSCDISDNTDSGDSGQEQTCLQEFATIVISNGHYLGLGGHCTGSFMRLFVQGLEANVSNQRNLAIRKTVDLFCVCLF